jgi:hypothetical protein
VLLLVLGSIERRVERDLYRRWAGGEERSLEGERRWPKLKATSTLYRERKKYPWRACDVEMLT